MKESYYCRVWHGDDLEYRYEFLNTSILKDSYYDSLLCYLPRNCNLKKCNNRLEKLNALRKL